MAGGLTGLASLAFFEDPGNHLKNVAVGASIGLYAGILLGAYMIYVVPEQNKPRPKHEELDSFELDSRLDVPAGRPLPYVVMGDNGALTGGFSMKF